MVEVQIQAIKLAEEGIAKVEVDTIEVVEAFTEVEASIGVEAFIEVALVEEQTTKAVVVPEEVHPEEVRILDITAF